MAVLLNYNSDQVVTIWLYPGKILQDINLATTLVGTLGIGIMIGFIIGLIQIFGQQREIMRQSSQLKKLRTELNNLRHSGLDETDVFRPGAPEAGEDEKPPMLPEVVDPEK
jgi:uncharacterized membrane protein YciS (DUF1049 family)